MLNCEAILCTGVTTSNLPSSTTKDGKLFALPTFLFSVYAHLFDVNFILPSSSNLTIKRVSNPKSALMLE